MKTTIEIELPELKEVKNFKWVIRGYEWKSGYKCKNAFIEPQVNDDWSYSEGSTSGMRRLLYAELVRTHREDGTPLEIPELPEMPDNVERVEYFGTGMKPEDMGDADAFIYKFKDMGEWVIMQKIESSVKISPSGSQGHYARVWYKKEKPEKTKISDLIGEGHQRIAYLIHFQDGIIRQFIPMIKHGEWRDFKSDRASLQIHYRYAHSLNTKFEDANPFIF